MNAFANQMGGEDEDAVDSERAMSASDLRTLRALAQPPDVDPRTGAQRHAWRQNDSAFYIQSLTRVKGAQ